MSQYKCFVIILYLIIIFDVRTNAQSSVFSSLHYVHRKNLNFKSGQERFPATNNSSNEVFDLHFGVLLPANPGKKECSFMEALPAMELAIRKLQQPGGLFEKYNIFVEYRDTKSSSTYCSLAAVDLYTKQSPGLYPNWKIE